MPRQEGPCEAALELKFRDNKRKVDFVIKRTLSGWAKRPTNRQGRWADDHPSVSSDDDEEEGEELLAGISVSNEEGLYVGMVERKRRNGPFATAKSSLTIKLADSFPAVTFLEERIGTSDESDSPCVKTLSPLFFVFIAAVVSSQLFRVTVVPSSLARKAPCASYSVPNSMGISKQNSSWFSMASWFAEGYKELRARSKTIISLRF
jgi:hypothetical protein